jgi:hypothetical protein
MTKYYKPINYSYDRLALLSLASSAVKGTPSEHSSMAHIINEKYFSAISDIFGEIFKDFSLHSVLFFNPGPSVGSTIHKDVPPSWPGGENLFAQMGLNLPLQNADNVNMKWYTVKENAQVQPTYIPRSVAHINPSGKTKLMVATKLNQCDVNECVDIAYYTNPMIVSINNWHSVMNESTTETASFLSVRFSSDVTLEKLLLKFGPA